ncbi:hypothetical protein KR074_007287 [Drosophila pseudoananassae]|nr:hypothetical protein KR074_007287 [Drosophila pseudoananassae]
MRMRGLLAVYLMFLRLLFHCTTSHVLTKRHSHLHKRMANSREIYNDFGALINGMPELMAPVPGGVPTPEGGGGEEKTKCVSQNQKCNVNEIIQPGDPKTKSSAIAMKAAADAKAASEAQSAAGQAAAQHIKLELAEKAFQSAKAAEAALMGKQMMVDQLEQEVQEANAVVEEETNGLHATENNMNAAVEAARAATMQFETISELQKTSRDNLANIQSVAVGAQNEMAVKTQLLEAARNRMNILHKQLLAAQEDYEKTKAAAYKAACAAVEAKQKASSSSFVATGSPFDNGIQRLSRRIRSLKTPAISPVHRFQNKLIFCKC